MIVLKSNPNDDILSLRLLLANEQKVVTSASSSNPLFHWGTRDENLQCNFLKVGFVLEILKNFKRIIKLKLKKRTW